MCIAESYAPSLTSNARGWAMEGRELQPKPRQIYLFIRPILDFCQKPCFITKPRRRSKFHGRFILRVFVDPRTRLGAKPRRRKSFRVNLVSDVYVFTKNMVLKLNPTVEIIFKKLYLCLRPCFCG